MIKIANTSMNAAVTLVPIITSFDTESPVGSSVAPVMTSVETVANINKYEWNEGS